MISVFHGISLAVLLVRVGRFFYAKKHVNTYTNYLHGINIYTIFVL